MKTLSLADCVQGGIYRVRGRNFWVAVYDGQRGFIGVREKFDFEYPFTEYYNDGTNPVGTVTVLEKIANVPPEMPLVATFESEPEDKYVKYNWDLFNLLYPYADAEDQLYSNAKEEVARAKRESQTSIKAFCHESNLIENINDSIADKISQDAWKWLRLQETITHDVIRKLQYKITQSQVDLPEWYRGVYRSTAHVNVTVGGRLCPPSHEVDALMDDWLETWLDRPWQEAHVAFEHIHPFPDGNGRTGRMLLNWQRRKLGLPMLVIWYIDRMDYYSWFNGDIPDNLARQLNKDEMKLKRLNSA